METSSGTKVTRRQLDALRRLSLASARARLSDKVEVEDAERATRLAQYCIDSFEAQMTPENVEHVGYVEDVNNQRTHEKLCHEIKVLSDDYENEMPVSVIHRHLSDHGFSKTFVEKWLRSMDSNELMLCDVTNDKWSCIGEWYKE